MTKIILVGEAWGRHEERFAHAFVGPSGVELARMLAQVDIAPELEAQWPSELDMIRHWKQVKDKCDIDLANVFDLHPESNNISLCFTSSKEGITSLPALKAGHYLRPDLLFHLEHLWQKISEARPNLIIALGNTASWAVLGESKITSIRGTVRMSPRLHCKVLPTFHPANLFYEGGWKGRPVILADLAKAKKEAEFSEVRRVERYITIEPSLDDIIAWLNRPADFYAVDIETFGGQISMIGFARSAGDAIVIPFLDKQSPTWSYWPSIEDEMQAWSLADALLKRPVPKVFQNGIFDLSYLLRAGLRPVMCNEDTMLLHHSLYPEMLKGLGFLGSIYSNEVAWKQMRTKGNNLKRDE